MDALALLQLDIELAVSHDIPRPSASDNDGDIIAAPTDDDKPSSYNTYCLIYRNFVFIL
ncbi:hypothetical protein EXIGLDRAFT_779064 [Exidia glandulosa HHB12029]|uniref:Uncharacterized protein n=1 Tax=Exidia glandulosa HHB12029 TaxID=1314781 RepID=A0A165C8K5_EXIGL|nr:hypothetical protein EXIGLDRAFT_779064 [Exidia glandulosa HHB12029]